MTVLPPKRFNPLDRFIDSILSVLDRNACKNCGNPMVCHATFGEWCQEGKWFSKVNKYEAKHG